MSTHSRPNVLWVCTEHQRYDTIHALASTYIRTPNLDRLTREGVAFTHAFAQNSVCTPSRSSFLTGRYPSTTRCRQNGQNIPESEVLITRELRDMGYDCGLAGKLHVSAAFTGAERRIDDGYRMFKWSHGATEKHGGAWIRWLADQGRQFDEVYAKSAVPFSREVSHREYHQTTWCFENALKFMQEDRDCPWLVSVNPFAVHDPFDFLTEYFEQYDPEMLPLPACTPGELDTKPRSQSSAFERGGFADRSAHELRQMVAAYYATIEHIDAEFGGLIDWLDDSGQRDNTLIIFHSDHGDMLGDHGIFQKGPYLYDCAVRVPLILSWPGHLPEGRQEDALVELVDLVPTLHELLGNAIPERVQGRSLVPLIEGRISSSEYRKFVTSEYYNSNPGKHLAHGTSTYLSMWRNRRHKIVVSHGEELGELYDLEADPGESENLWNDAGSRELKAELMKKCFDSRVFTMDPMPPRVHGF